MTEAAVPGLGTMHRCRTPAQTLARLEPLLPVFGITRVANVTGLDRIGIPVVMVARPLARSISVSQGKGLTLDAAKVGGLMEAIEVWHAERITQPLRMGSAAELAQEYRVVDVGRLVLTVDPQVAHERPTLWVEGRDLSCGQGVWVPYEMVSTDYTLPLPPGSGMFEASTNGLASGNDSAEAECHALCEVVERDATVRWKRLPASCRDARTLDLDSVHDPACRDVIARLRAAGLSIHAWETTSDVRVAAFVCLVMEMSGDFADPEFGAGCHPRRAAALLSALLEAAQARTTFITGARDDFAPDAWEARHRHRRHRACSSLLPRSPAQRRFDAAPDVATANAAEDRSHVMARLQETGYDQAIAVDLSKSAIGIPVVKVVVPGLVGPLAEEQHAPVHRERAKPALLRNRVAQWP